MALPPVLLADVARIAATMLKERGSHERPAFLDATGSLP